MTIVTQLNSALTGHYAVEREIGAGGMATVYLARDLKHDRQVALKLLNPELGAVLGGERFLGEIRVTATLQHPNLLPLFDSGEANGLLFYVMPFIAGESLRARLDREKQLPVEEAVRLTVAIAEALDYAHGHGVIHRDLKPENILLQHGQPIVADFGIALAVSNAGGARITQTGLSLGTPQYMSPEQAMGDRVIDGRTDVYSLGAMLYEMLVGDPPHSASTAQAVVAKVLTERPRDVRASRPAVPEHVAAAVDRALEKLPADRWATAREFAQALQGRATTVLSASLPSPRIRASSRGSRIGIAAAAAIAAFSLGAAAMWWVRHGQSPQVEAVRFVVNMSDGVRPVDAAAWAVTASPDGKVVVFPGQGKTGKYQLYARSVDQLQVRPIPGTEGAVGPVFSPDGKWIAFQSGGKLRKVPREGGTPLGIGDQSALNGMDWAPGDVIVLGATGRLHGLSRVSAVGGDQPKALTQTDTAERDHVWPVVLHDGKTVAFAIWRGGLQASTLALASLDDGAVTRLGVNGIAPLGVFEQHLVYVRADGVVMAVPFDLSARKVTGQPVPVVDQVPVCGGCNGDARVRISRNGTLVYLSAGAGDAHLVWVSETGQETPAFSEPKAFRFPNVSPNGRQVLLGIQGPTGADSWILDLTSRMLSKLPVNANTGVCQWTPDGKRVVYRVDKGDVHAYFEHAADGSGEPRKLVDAPDGLVCPAVSPDGRTLIYTTYRQNNADMIAVPIDNASAAHVVAPSAADEMAPAFSPDSRWIAFASTLSGQSEIYVSAFPGSGARVQISDKGGSEPRWSRDGTQIYYREESRMVAASVTTAPALAVTSRKTLFEGSYQVDPFWTAYDVVAGPKFLMLKQISGSLDVVVVANWLTELRKKVATR